MSGTDIIGALLLADNAVTAEIPATRIKAGRLPDNIVLSALVVSEISVVERHMLKRVGWERVTARIAVTARAASYRDQKAAIKLVRSCCAGRTGNIGGGQNVVILTAGLGPDLGGPGDSYEKTQDFKVSYDALV